MSYARTWELRQEGNKVGGGRIGQGWKDGGGGVTLNPQSSFSCPLQGLMTLDRGTVAQTSFKQCQRRWAAALISGKVGWGFVHVKMC